jgi:MATE family multidrug resistance protein
MVTDPQNNRPAARSSEVSKAGFAPWWDEIRMTCALALPLVLTQLAVIAIHTTDVLMMGWLGPQELAAGTLASAFYTPLFFFGLGLLTAVAPICAQALGARQYRTVRRTVRQGFWVAIAVALPFCAIIYNVRPFLLAFGQSEINAGLAELYLRAAMWGLLPSLWVIVLRCFVSALSRPRSILLVTLLGVVANALGNYALMFGKFGFPALGLLGAGITTSIVNFLMFAAMLSFVSLDRRMRRFAIVVRFWRPDWSIFRSILKVGLPIGVSVVSETGMFAVAAFMMGLIGTAATAGHAVALQCAAVAFMVPLGVSQAATIRVGHAAGRRNPQGVWRAGWTSLGLSAVFCSGSALLFWFFPLALISLFLDPALPVNAESITLAVSFLGIAALFQIVDGLQIVGAGALRGLRDTKVPMVISAIGYWVLGFGTSAWLGFVAGLEGYGIWIGLALGLTSVAVALLWRFARLGRALGREEKPVLVTA